MAIGVDYVLFWTLNPKKIEPFIEAHKQKQIFWQEEVNFTAWLNGVYITNAIATCFSENHQYPNMPISLSGKDEGDTVNAQAQKFDAFAIQFNENFKKHYSTMK